MSNLEEMVEQAEQLKSHIEEIGLSEFSVYPLHKQFGKVKGAIDEINNSLDEMIEKLALIKAIPTILEEALKEIVKDKLKKMMDS